MTKRQRQNDHADINNAFCIGQDASRDQIYLLAAFGKLSKQSGDLCTVTYMELLERH